MPLDALSVIAGAILIFTVCLFCWACYEFYTAVPPTINQKWLFRVVFMMFKVNRFIAHILTFFRVFGSTMEENMAAFTDWMLPECIMDDEHVSTTLQNFNGIPVRVHRPKKVTIDSGLLPALVYFHGGGFVYGSSASFHPFTRRLCESLQSVVVSVDYRLAPAHLFPVAVDDSREATKWLLLNGPTLNVDPRRIGVAGDSAGGLLAAAVAKQILDEPSIPNLKLQVLFYPALQLLNVGSPSHIIYDAHFNTHGGMLTRREAVSYLATYILGKSPDYDAFVDLVSSNSVITPETNPKHVKYVDDNLVPDHLRNGMDLGKTKESLNNNPELLEKYGHFFEDPRLSPVIAESMDGLPTAYVVTGDNDCLRDDGVFYVKRLEAAGVSAHWVNYEGGFHGMLPIVFNFFEVGLKAENDFVEFARGFL
ncbi:arylacetamide deacetylase-like [Asterias amurensis]|uniref:arylacetamide deacetylase-like n=1 Tax=Asterias amurensis TaxID=7602 RepID=UPI003AB80BA0